MLNKCRLLCPPGIDSWINLSRVDPDAEVQGEIYLAVQMLEDVRGRSLRCHVLKARYGHGGGCGRWSENEQESPGCPQLPCPLGLPHSWGTSELTTRIPCRQTIEAH